MSCSEVGWSLLTSTAPDFALHCKVNSIRAIARCGSKAPLTERPLPRSSGHRHACRRRVVAKVSSAPETGRSASHERSHFSCWDRCSSRWRSRGASTLATSKTGGIGLMWLIYWREHFAISCVLAKRFANKLVVGTV